MKMSKWRQLAVQAAMVGAVLVSFSAAAAGNVPSFKEVPAIKGDASFCIGQTDGVYEHPDCRVYYRCSKNIATQVNCPDGQVYDDTKNPYDEAGKSYCGVPATVPHFDCGGLALQK